MKAALFAHGLISWIIHILNNSNNNYNYGIYSEYIGVNK